MDQPTTATRQAASGEGLPGRWAVLAAATCGTLVSYPAVLVYSFGVFAIALGREFHWSRGQIFAAFAIVSLTAALIAPVLGRLVDRFGARSVVLACLTVFGLGFASLGLLTGNLWHLLAVFFVMGLVANGTTPLSYNRMVIQWFDRDRGLAFAIVTAGIEAGGIISPWLANQLIGTHAHWRSAYAIMGGLVLLIGLVPIALFLREPPVARTPGARPGPRDPDVSAGPALRSFRFLAIAGSMFLCCVASVGIVSNLAPLLTDRGFSVSLAAAATSVLAISALLGRLIVGHLVDRFFAPYVAALVLTGSAGGILILGYVPAPWAPWIAAILIGAGLGTETDVAPYLLSRYFGLRCFGQIYGYVALALGIGSAVGPIAMGIVFDRFHTYGPALPVLAFLTFLAALLFLKLPAYQKAPAR